MSPATFRPMKRRWLTPLRYRLNGPGLKPSERIRSAAFPGRARSWNASFWRIIYDYRRNRPPPQRFCGEKRRAIAC